MRLFPIGRVVIAPLLFLLVLLLVLFKSSPLQALPLEAYSSLPTINDVVISPNGQLIAYRNTTDDLDAMLVYSLKEGKRIAAIQLSEEVNPEHIEFLNDNILLLKATTIRRLSGYRGKHKLNRAFIYDIKKNDVKPVLLNRPPVFPGQTNFGSVVGVSKDKKQIYMDAYVGDRHVENPKYGVLKVNLKNNKIIKIGFNGDTASRDFILGPDGDVIVNEMYNDRNNMHSIEVKVGRKWREIYKKESDIPEIGLLGITPDYQKLVFSTDDTKSGQTEFWYMSMQSGEISATPFNKPGFDSESLITDINRVVYGVRFSGFNPSYKFLDSALDKRVANLLQQFEGNSVWIQSWTPGWSKLIIKVEGSSFAGQFYSADKNNELSLIASSRPDIKTDAIHPIAKFSYKAGDGLNIPTLLTIPRQSLSNMKNLPTVMMPHGGPASYDRIGFDWLAQALADQGYLVIQPQFRGSRGFGTEHYYAGDGEWGGKMQSDLDDGVAALVKKGMVNPEQVCILGWSYGGYAALAAAAFSPDLYKCAVSINGVSDMKKMIHTEKFTHGRDSWIVPYFERKIQSDDDSKDAAALVSPARHADQVKAPVLLLHSELDQRVDKKQSKFMESALKKAKKSVRYVELKSDNHHIESRATRKQALDEIIHFLDSNLSAPNKKREAPNAN